LSINVYNELEHIKLLLSIKSFDEAYILVTSFIEKYGSLSEAVFVKAKISRRLRKFDELLELFKSLEKVSEYKLESYWGQSLIYTALKNDEDRKKYYENIVHFSTNIPLLKESKKLLKEIFDKNLTSSTLLLTTFPKHASNNVGDQLISSSTIELIKSKIPDFNPIIEFRVTNLDNYENSIVKNILAPGFFICNRTYPELYGLYSDIDKYFINLVKM